MTGQEERGREAGDRTAIMLSLQCPACDWIWGFSFPCEIQGTNPRCPKCAHQPVLVLKVYSV